MVTLRHWIEVQLRARNWRPADLARAAKLKDATLSRVLNGDRRAGPDVCNAVARAFGVEPEFVFRLAGLLPPITNQKNEPDQAEMIREIYYALKQQQPATLPAVVVVPPPVNLPDDEHLMELFQTLDLTRKRQAYDYLRYILQQQLDPSNSSGHHERERKRQEYQRVIGEIDLYLAVHQATPEELERLISELVLIVEAMPDKPHSAADTGPASAARPLPPPAARQVESDGKLAETPHPVPD